MKSFKLEIERIRACLSTKELPGMESQLKMAPITRLVEISKSQLSSAHDGNTPKKSAVLVLFYPKNNGVSLVLMVRATDESIHSGQVSFPGGKVEENDASLTATALREAYEEIGVVPETVEIIGRLSKLYIPPSNFDVYPIVGVTTSTPTFSTNNEVSSLLEIDLSTLLNGDIMGYEKIYHRTGGEFVVPCFHINGEVVWGATAMMLVELLDVIGG